MDEQTLLLPVLDRDDDLCCWVILELIGFGALRSSHDLDIISSDVLIEADRSVGFFNGSSGEAK